MTTSHFLTIFLFTLTVCFILAAAFSHQSSHPMVTFPIYHIGNLPRSLFNQTEYLTPYMLSPEKLSTWTPLVTPSQGKHVVEMRIGANQRLARLLLDTGSSLIWWQCLPCKPCFTQDIEVPYYNSNLSLSYRQVHCLFDEECDYIALRGVVTGCHQTNFNDTSCHYRIQYMDDDKVEGELAIEILWSRDQKFRHTVTFGCGRNNTGQNFGGCFIGILGFDQNKFSFLLQVNALKFSFCLPSYNNDPEDSLLYLFAFPERPNDAFDVTLIPNMFDFYFLDVVGITIDGEDIPVSPEVWQLNQTTKQYGVMVHTGTGITRFPDKVYTAFRDKFVQECEWETLPAGSHQLFDTCFDVLPYFADEFPTVSLHFGGGNSLQLGSEKSLVYLGDNIHCLAFAPLPVHHRNWQHTILGSHQIEKTRFSFDLSQKIVTISPQDC